MRQRPSTMSDKEKSVAILKLRQNYLTHFSYFNDDKPMSIRDRPTIGLKLPERVLQDFYVNTPKAWYPEL